LIRRSTAVVAVLFLASCGGGAPEPSQSPTSQATASPVPAVPIDWSARPDEPVSLAGGFSVQGCPGDAPFLCISREGDEVGLVEYLNFPASPGTTVDGLIEDDYRTFTEDREGTCPTEFEVKTDEPAGAEVGGSEGRRSGYSVVDGDGRTVERYVKYWAVEGGAVHLVSAEAQEEGTCSPGDGAEFSDAVLADFEPSFAAVAAGSRFPAPPNPAPAG
jgi:hypothetical protein